jgi:coiled-coil domain-containing protein 55
MEEMSQAEEEEARQARMEAALDVTKQNDLSGFYRHIYRQVCVN